MAPGPVLGRFFPIGGYFGPRRLGRAQPGPGSQFRTAMNKSLAYSQANSDEVRALLLRCQPERPAADLEPLIAGTGPDRSSRGTRRSTASISSLPNISQAPAELYRGWQDAAGERSVNAFITLRQDGKIGLRADRRQVQHRGHGRVEDPGLPARRAWGEEENDAGIGRITWSVTLKKGTYKYSSTARPALKKSFKVT